MKKKIIFLAAGIIISSSVLAQQKIGSSGAPNTAAVLELVSPTGSPEIQRGLLMPKVSISNTTTWNLAGTSVAGMSVYNTNATITSSNTNYPAAGIGEYYWDGTGWISKKNSTDFWNLNGNAGTTANTSPIGTAVNNNFIGTTDNTAWIMATSNLERMRISPTGNVGISKTNPTHKLHVDGSATGNPVRFEGLSLSADNADKMVVATSEGVLKLSQSPAIGVLTIGLTTLETLTRQNPGDVSFFTNESIIINTIPEASYDPSTNSGTIPAGTYQITLAFNGNLSTSTQTNPINSYFFDFPTNSGSPARLHSNQSTRVAGQASHGGTLTYVGKYTSPRTISLHLGWGQGGNVEVGSTILLSEGTQLTFVRIGD